MWMGVTVVTEMALAGTAGTAWWCNWDSGGGSGVGAAAVTVTVAVVLESAAVTAVATLAWGL